jgi:hypothetical protein
MWSHIIQYFHEPAVYAVWLTLVVVTAVAYAITTNNPLKSKARADEDAYYLGWILLFFTFLGWAIVPLVFLGSVFATFYAIFKAFKVVFLKGLK